MPYKDTGRLDVARERTASLERQLSDARATIKEFRQRAEQTEMILVKADELVDAVLCDLESESALTAYHKARD